MWKSHLSWAAKSRKEVQRSQETEKESQPLWGRMHEGLLKPRIAWGSEMRWELFWGGSECVAWEWESDRVQGSPKKDVVQGIFNPLWTSSQKSFSKMSLSCPFKARSAPNASVNGQDRTELGQLRFTLTSHLPLRNEPRLHRHNRRPCLFRFCPDGLLLLSSLSLV